MISIIIPAFKSVKFIDECIDSINIPGVEILIGVDGCEETYNHIKHNIISLYEYLNTLDIFNNINKDKETDNNKYIENVKKTYNFDNTIAYYENREENKFVGIIDLQYNKLMEKQSLMPWLPSVISVLRSHSRSHRL